MEAAVDGHKTIISEELNVKAVVTSADVTALVELSAKANFRTLGPRMGSEVKALALAIEGLDAVSVERLVETGELAVDGVDLSLDDVIISRDPLPGVVVASDGPLSVALDLELTDELRAEGVAREVVSNVQQLQARTSISRSATASHCAGTQQTKTWPPLSKPMHRSSPQRFSRPR